MYSKLVEEVWFSKIAPSVLRQRLLPCPSLRCLLGPNNSTNGIHIYLHLLVFEELPYTNTRNH